MNVALYRLDGGGGHWAMTERGRGQLQRDATTLAIGPSALSWENDALVIRIDEITAPIPVRLRGSVRVTPNALSHQSFPLDAEGVHIWRPIAPRARVDVALTSPDLQWRGDGYLDTNHGAEPLERGFRRWDWGRAHLHRDVLLFYDAERRDGSADSLSLRANGAGEITAIDPFAAAVLPKTGWGVERRAWRDAGARVTVRKTLEDTPFYARSALDTRLKGEAALMMHESLTLDRLRSPIVRAMLPFRMPRILW